VVNRRDIGNAGMALAVDIANLPVSDGGNPSCGRTTERIMSPVIG
jgi:hypothetical protein